MNVPDKWIGNSGVMARIAWEHRCPRDRRSICHPRIRVFITKTPDNAVILKFGRRQMWRGLSRIRQKTILKPVAVMLKKALRSRPLTEVSSKFTKMRTSPIAKLLSKEQLRTENRDKALWRAMSGWKRHLIRLKKPLLS